MFQSVEGPSQKVAWVLFFVMVAGVVYWAESTSRAESQQPRVYVVRPGRAVIGPAGSLDLETVAQMQAQKKKIHGQKAAAGMLFTWIMQRRAGYADGGERVIEIERQGETMRVRRAKMELGGAQEFWLSVNDPALVPAR